MEDVKVVDLDGDLVGLGVEDVEREGLVPLGVDRFLDDLGLEFLVVLAFVAGVGQNGVRVALPVEVGALQALGPDDLEYEFAWHCGVAIAITFIVNIITSKSFQSVFYFYQTNFS